MFCKRTYCALLLMIDVTLAYNNNKQIDIDFVSHKHSIAPEAFNGIVEKLKETKLITIINGKLITIINGKLHLLTPPDQITVWQIVMDIAAESVFTGRYFDDEKPVRPTSAMIMLHKERENLLRMIENRLR